MDRDFRYKYTKPSEFSQKDKEKLFSFSYCTELEEDLNVPCFFYGKIIDSYIASRCLSALANTVGSHYALTPGQIARLKDPIVSVGNNQLHFEAFSSCNSVYARVNILSNGIDGEFLHSGCTNIDFNNNTIRAFNAVSKTEKLLVGVGSKEVQFITEKKKTTEKKVTLPNRWIKGLGNVQMYMSEMDLAFRLTKIEALQLFRTLPKTSIKGNYFLNKTSNIYAFSPLKKSNSILIGGIHRLNLLQSLISSIDSLFIYKNESEQSFSLILNFKSIQMTFLFSNSVYRGFSGEGKLLKNLTIDISPELILSMNNFFKTNEVFDPTLISIENDIKLKTMQGLQSSLSSIGLLGYNLFDNNYFYRKLPFKIDRLLGYNPRLKNAKKIIVNNEISILIKKYNYTKASIKGSNGIHHTVIKEGSTYKCTCNWYTNNQNKRGMCKHILALSMTFE